ncbi:DNA-binding transcriptional regulator IlvY [Yersinia enterocolitica]|uniref:LysR-family transcriptional regulatory protein n=1 Tax=Yersinia enterocolitica serotype O:8 / biotype 1B (strain NCTC 13174 / 8081) TaxID=393305 RepID=A1JI56_YERE8|nr:HTH-type transcriptional activator IlvY [Yersinia enterocolitica]AJI83026.1 bacterial regulatory helix-turn-helix, lysR family protein [Yersinia enterocolitica]AJJ24517.1 bacterial regulatory helix-turn-helix, lysR family protein [Yersinia enterocolitica]EKA25325.1 DNA-binding transcriptional regulator IlvY [Yersinia enterocolitica subsp. enterocolitica WA-314]ELI8284952.1 HTH-type transcriptional activator IlvY [Yersinia enterocolitica]KGA73574.1 bacterial regulatory helix-turn-helix, lysR
MDLRDLKLFLHLAESRHFGRSAKAMHVSPSTLSRQIQRLEETIGQPLFLRDNRTVQLTDAGTQLKAFAQQTLLQYQQLRHALGQHGPSLSGELRLFCSVTAAYSHLPPILDRFRARHPLVEIKLTTGDAADAVDKVQSNEADLGIAGRPEVLPTSVAFTQIGEIPLVLIAPALPCAVRSQVSVDQPDWATIPFILPEHGPSRKRIDLWFRRQRITNPLIYATVSGHEAIVSMVALGCGVALIPSVVVDNSPEPVRNRISLLDDVSLVEPFELGVCVQKKRLNEPLIEAFWGLL